MKTPTLLMTIMAACLVGCATHTAQKKQAEETARREAAAKAEAEAEAARERRFQEGWPKLRKCMTAAEVSETLGITFGLLPIQGTVGFPNGHSVSFIDGTVREWK